MYPVARLNQIAIEFPDHAKMLWKQSRRAVTKMAAGERIPCPTCLGHGQLVSYTAGFRPRLVDAFVCPTCDGEKMVLLPCPHDDLIGGWHCCPVCGEGQNPDEEPCDVCQYLIDREVGTLDRCDTAEIFGYDGEHWD